MPLCNSQALAAFVLIGITSLASVNAIDYSAISNANWNVAGTWTPAGGPPGAADNASIGSSLPGAANATVALTANQSVQSVFLGRNGGTNGTLNLANSVLTVGNTLSFGQFGGVGTITRGTGRFTTGVLSVASANSFSMGAADVASSLEAYSASLVSTSNIGNITSSVGVYNGSSQLTLGANLNVTNDVELRGSVATVATLNAAGFNLTARDIYVGHFGDAGQILNDGAITATRNFLVSRGTFAFDANDTVAGGLFADSAATVTLHSSTQLDFIQLNSGATTTIVNTANVTDSIAVDNSGTQLNLAANLNLTGDFQLRGSAAVASTLDAGGFNLTARDIFVGRFGDAGQILNDGAITATGNFLVSRSSFAFDANDTVAGGLFADSAATVTLHSSTQLDFIQLNSGATTTIVNTGNVTDSVAVDNSGSQLNLAANMNLTGDFQLRGTGAAVSTLDAGGFNLTARDIFVGRFGDAGQILNDGAITATRNFLVSRGAFAFDSNDTVAGGLFADSAAAVTLHLSTQLDFIQLNSGATTTIVNTGNVTDSVAVDNSGTQLNLAANLNLTGDFQLRGTAAAVATLDAGGFNLTARDIYVGRFGDAGQILNDGAITATRNFLVSRGAFAFDANDTVAGGLFADSAAAVTLHPSTQLDFIQLNSGATTTIVNTGNVTDSVAVDNSGSQLNLAANLNLTGDLQLRGAAAAVATLDAGGFNLTARDIYVGRFGDAGQILNDGVITATRNFIVSRGTFAFDANDTVAGGLFVEAGGTSTIASTANVTNSVNVTNAGSQLNLAANLNLTGDLELRGTAGSPSTLDAGGFNLTARDIYVGRFGDAGQILNDGVITATRNFIVSRGSFAFDANDTVAAGLFIEAGGTSTIASTANVTNSVNVANAGSQLNLAANLNLTADLELRGSAGTPSTLDAGGFNVMARDIFVGRFGDAGQILNDGAITATRNFLVSRGTFAFDANDTVAGGLFADTGAVVTLHASTRLSSIQLNSGATTTIINSGNVIDSVAVVDSGSQMNLAVNLSVTSDVDLRGTLGSVSTLNANGMDMVVGRDLFVGRFGGSASLQNVDLLTVNRNMSVEKSSLVLNGGFDLVRSSLSLVTGSVLTVNQTADSVRGLSLEGPTLSIQDTSVMNLSFDGTLGSFGDWVFRWANPSGGNRVSAIQSLISAGRIVVTSGHPFVVVDNGDGYTYVAKFATDYSGDTALNCSDLNLLTAAVVAGSGNLAFDLNSDGLVNLADRDTWLMRAGSVFVRSGNSYRPGDANLDGVVDGTDLGIWNANKFTTSSSWCAGDFNTDGVVDGSDFGIWNANKFTSSDSLNLVPEPSLAAIFLLVFGSLVRRKSA